MACFLVPTTEAIVTTVIKHAADKKGSDNIFIKKNIHTALLCGNRCNECRDKE